MANCVLLTQGGMGANAGAAITCVVAQAPLIGNLARGGVENTVGTMLGGTLGFCVFLLAHILACVRPSVDRWTLLAFIAHMANLFLRFLPTLRSPCPNSLLVFLVISTPLQAIPLWGRLVV